MSYLKIVLDIISVLASIITLFLIWSGLQTWKIQLKGENTFKLSFDILLRLKQVLLEIHDYRSPMYLADEIYDAFHKRNSDKVFDPMNREDKELAFRYAELDRWNKIIDKLRVYEETVLKLSVLIDNYDIDLIDNKRLRNYILELRDARTEKEILDDEEQELNNVSIEERAKIKASHRDEKMKLNNILFRSSKNDELREGLEQHFSKMNDRLKKYLK